MKMDSPKDDEWYKTHKNILLEFQDEENEYNHLLKNGIKCDSCQDLYLLYNLKLIRTSTNETKMVCKYCYNEK